MITKYRKFEKVLKHSSRLPQFFKIVFLLFLIGIILSFNGYLVIRNFKINEKRTELNSSMDALKQKIGILEKRNKELKAEILWASEQEHLEKQARERLNLKKPGEKVVTVVPEEKEEKNKESLEIIKPKSWWQKILEKLGF